MRSTHSSRPQRKCGNSRNSWTRSCDDRERPASRRPVVRDPGERAVRDPVDRRWLLLAAVHPLDAGSDLMTEIDLLSFTGVGLILLAYFLLATRRWQRDSVRYHLTNAAGALLV